MKRQSTSIYREPQGLSCLKLLTAAVVILLGSLYSNCAVLRQITDPLTGTIKRGSCFAIDIPPITLTPERTATERQLLGESHEIEKSGWLIASSQNLKKEGEQEKSDNGEKQSELRQLQRERAVLDYYREQTIEYLNKGYIGEDFSGKLMAVPEKLITTQFKNKFFLKDEIKKALKVAADVNHSRLWIFNFYLKREKSKSSSDLEKVKIKYLQSYWHNAPIGSWIRSQDKKWTRK